MQTPSPEIGQLDCLQISNTIADVIEAAVKYKIDSSPDNPNIA